MNRLLTLSALIGSCLGGDLITLSKKKSLGSKCCGGEHIKSCDTANVDFNNLGTEEISLPGGLTLNFQGNIAENPNAYAYGSNDGEAVITMNPSYNGLHGHALSAAGDSYVLEYCGSEGHVWKSIDTENMPGDHGKEMPMNRLSLEMSPPEPVPVFPILEISQPEAPPPQLVIGGAEPVLPGGGELEAPFAPLLPGGGGEVPPPESPLVPSLPGGGGEVLPSIQGSELPAGENEGAEPQELPAAEGELGVLPVASDDNTTIVTYSVKFWYTADVAADTADIDGFLDQVISETNQGYENSNIPLRIMKHCAEQTTIAETGDASEMLDKITYATTDPAVTRDGADVAALITLNLDYCGMAWMSQLSSGYTFSVTKKSCATGYYSFGHEVGHNIGAQHNPEASTNTYYSYAHGHLIAQGSANTGARTIMGYNAPGHAPRVNYWSNPAVNHPITNTPTGVAGLSNNAALLTLQRFALSLIGDETTGSCKTSATTLPPVTIPPVTTLPPVTVPPVTTLPPITLPPVTTMPPVTKPPTTSTGMIKKNSIVKGLKPIKGKQAKKAKNPKACQALCGANKKCVAFNFNMKKKACQLMQLVFKKKKGYVAGTP